VKIEDKNLADAYGALRPQEQAAIEEALNRADESDARVSSSIRRIKFELKRKARANKPRKTATDRRR